MYFHVVNKYFKNSVETYVSFEYLKFAFLSHELISLNNYLKKRRKQVPVCMQLSMS